MTLNGIMAVTLRWIL